tara:strand:- start:13 stop:531 length:519 start_codon:yes stop_codon:yes gene_type:complete
MSSMDELQQIINDLEEENKKLKEENEKLKKDNWTDVEIEEKINEVFDEYGLEDNYLSEQEPFNLECWLNDVSEHIKETEEIEEENKIQDIYDGMTKNLILSLLSTQKDEMEWKIKNDYTKYCNEEMHEYIQDKIKEMNDTDWNDDGGSLKIEYDDNYTISVVFNDEEDSDDE